MGKPVNPPSGGEIETINLKEALEERYLAYALSTIMHRALPDARDGLKPVHRRILHAMRLLRLDPGGAYKKCARIVGDVMGKFHPHGDQAIYDALVRLAQDFAQRYPLVDGQGNFGNIDGDNAAAMRYTEARLTEVARLLLEGIDEDAVDFRPNLRRPGRGADRAAGRLPEPARQRLAGHRGRHGDLDPAAQRRRTLRRGALPHREAPKATSEQLRCSSCPARICRPAASSSTRRPPSPRPTAPGAARSACARAGQGGSGRGTWQIVVTEIPYRVPKSRLIEKIAELLQERKLPLLADVRDESAEDVRIVLEPRAAHRRSGHPDGIAVQAHRAREPHSDERERARRRQGAEGARPRGVPARMARPPPRGARSPLAPPPRCDRPAPRDPAAACSSSISISTGSSKSSARRTSRSRS